MKPNTRSRLLGSLRLIAGNKEALTGTVIVIGFMLIALLVSMSNLFGIQITPYDPIAQNVGPALAPPSFAHLLGTDVHGRDLFSRIIVATPNDVAVSLTVVGVALAAGAMIGSVRLFEAVSWRKP